MLLPELIVQPLAWSASLAAIALLLLGKQQQKKAKIAWLIVGLSGSYLIGTTISWQGALFNQIIGYIGLLLASLLVLLGVFGIFIFFDKNGAKLQAKITQDLNKIKTILETPRSTWLYALTGVIIGIIEPIQLQTGQQNEIFLLLAQPSPAAISNLISYVLAVLLPIALFLGCGWLIARSAGKATVKTRLAILLCGSVAIIIAGWLLAAIATGLI